MSLNRENTGLIRVTVKVPVYWHEPHLWAWSQDGRNAFYSWPGGIMTRAEDCYTLLAPEWVDFIIINACGGYYKTDDIPLLEGKDVFLNIRDRDNYILSFDEMEYFADSPRPERPLNEVREEPWIFPDRKNKTQLGRKLFAVSAALTVSLGAGLFLAVKRRKKIRM